MSDSNPESAQSTTKPPAPRTTFTDANANSFSDKVLRWELLQVKLAPLLDSMPHVKPVYDELVQLITDAKKHVFELTGIQATARQGSIDRKAFIRTGDGIRSRLASAISFEHGATSVLLTEFGLRPRKGRPKQTPPPPVVEPPPQPEVQTTGKSGAATGKVE
jgi:hypothetical protein